MLDGGSLNLAINGCEIKIIKSLIDRASGASGKRPRVLMLGYPDVLATEETFSNMRIPVTWETLPKRENSEPVWKGHGRDFGNYPMCESKALIKALGGEPMIVDAIQWGAEDEIIDLNLPLEQDMRERLGEYDLIIDPGTVEHCFNVAQVFMTIVDLLAPSGFIYHQAAVAFPNHGFWSLSPTAFFDFYESRQFVLGVPYIWNGIDDKNGFEPRFVRIDPFTVPEDFPPRMVGTFVFQKGGRWTSSSGSEPTYPIQRCYSGKKYDIPMEDFAGQGLVRS